MLKLIDDCINYFMLNEIESGYSIAENKRVKSYMNKCTLLKYIINHKVIMILHVWNSMAIYEWPEDIN